MNNAYQVIIVGSGPAGLAAADLLAGFGMRVLLADDNAMAGGQLLRRPGHTGKHFKPFEPDRLKKKGLRLVDHINTGKVEFINGSQVLGIYPERVLLLETMQGQGRVMEFKADAIILATGSREKFLPFKGWTLPGVLSTGAAQILMKGSGILPARKMLIGGLGPLPLVLASEFATHGGKVTAVFDQSCTLDKLKIFASGRRGWSKIVEGAMHLGRLAVERVPVRQGTRIVKAAGKQHLESILIGRVDDRGRVVQGSEKSYPAATLAIGYGFSPNLELPQQAGCTVSHDVDRGGWHVNVSATMETSLPDIYAAGEATGIAGAGKSYIEGKIAGMQILYKNDRIGWREFEKQVRPLLRRQKQEIRYGRFLNRLCHVKPGCYEDIPDDTIICRCEEITMGEIRRQLAGNFMTMNSIKKSTRITMGRCQGRICGQILFDIISAFTHHPPETVGYTSARTPVKNVALGSLARMTDLNDKGGDPDS